jgi:hypothetical protein
MALFKVQPTAVDVAIANQIASRTGRRSEHAAEALTWGADEHVLCALAAAWWLYSRYRDRATRRAGDHILFTTLTASALPHCLKKIFDQERPDRMTVKGHFHGIPLSGNRLDAFPSGHLDWKAFTAPSIKVRHPAPVHRSRTRRSCATPNA